MELRKLPRVDGNFIIPCDGVSHYALGGGSYAFMSDYPQYLISLLPAGARQTEINISLQPSYSPHFGTLYFLTLTFILAKRLQKLGIDVLVTCDLRDEAKGEQLEINEITYQRSLRATGELEKYLSEYEDLCLMMATNYGVKHIVRHEKEILRQECIPRIIQQVIERREEYGKVFNPCRGLLPCVPIAPDAVLSTSVESTTCIPRTALSFLSNVLIMEDSRMTFAKKRTN